MRIQYLVQPKIQFGSRICELLSSEPSPDRVILVSAFANYHTLLRYRSIIHRLIQKGSQIRIVLGIDMEGTSKEALEEVLSWNIDARIVKNRFPGSTFHPKIYLFEHDKQADILIGSNNLTEGGFYKNLECSLQITYDFPEDKTNYDDAMVDLFRFLDPQDSLCQILSEELITKLINRGDIIPLLEAKKKRNMQRQRRAYPNIQKEESPFGGEKIVKPPYPINVMDELIKNVTSDKKRKQKSGEKVLSVDSSMEISPDFFYMTLPKMRGENIPGEARIPFEARDLAEYFWGWPKNYESKPGPRNPERMYLEWKPIWRIYDSENPSTKYTQEVRMYEYVQSSDFRFYTKKLLDLGADEGDIIRIERVSDFEAEYECVLARKNTDEYANWLQFCAKKVKNSKRLWGYV